MNLSLFSSTTLPAFNSFSPDTALRERRPPLPLPGLSTHSRLIRAHTPHTSMPETFNSFSPDTPLFGSGDYMVIIFQLILA